MRDVFDFQRESVKSGCVSGKEHVGLEWETLPMEGACLALGE